jgi:predicted dehydrogenase/nucleoside-diphosphate-sugar epimerase
MRRVCLIGAGSISHVHAEVLSGLANVRLHGVFDPNARAAEAVAGKWGIPRIFGSVEEAVASGEVDCVHVLAPPELHASAALPFLKARIPALVEKPLAVSKSECETLISIAAESGVPLGVNQNFVFHPAFIRLREAVERGRIGRPSFANCTYSVSLRQIAARQFGHWMFRAPGNILLEQAVHPLSQIVSIAGHIGQLACMAGTPKEISPGVPFYDSVTMILRGARLPATMRIAVGQAFPFWQLSVIGDDGVAVADMLNNRFFTYERGKWLEAYDLFLSGAKTGLSVVGASARNFLDFNLSLLRLKPRGDSFFRGMRDSIATFHRALDAGSSPEIDGAFGAHLVGLCEDAARAAFKANYAPARAQSEGGYRVAILGGTGFIGSHVVRRLLGAGERVAVMARNTANLPAVFYDDRVVIVRGDIRQPTDVKRAIGGASVVINLAHGGGGGTYQEVRAAMVGGAEVVARACLEAGVQRLVHIGSIASLYLGPQAGAVTDATPPDPKSELRADYARAKAECDRMLLSMYRSEGLPVCILRPGLVVGDGTAPLHSGLGFFNNEQHCIGWNAGRNPLPFILVQDVAEAVFRACDASNVAGQTYNLVGDVRLSAREYLAELSRVTRRPLRFHPQSPMRLWVEELGKWGLKVAIGRKASRPTRRDFLSRGLTAKFVCDDAKRALGWSPVADRDVFIRNAIEIHAQT